MTAKQLIEMTVKQTVAELKRNGLIRENKLDSFRKTEKALDIYHKLKHISETYKFDDMQVTVDFIRMIDDALESISDDPYYEIIPMKYFDGKTHEQIAEYFDVQPSAISKQRKRLINKLRPLIFPNDFISELYNGI